MMDFIMKCIILKMAVLSFQLHLKLIQKIYTLHRQIVPFVIILVIFVFKLAQLNINP